MLKKAKIKKDPITGGNNFLEYAKNSAKPSRTGSKKNLNSKETPEARQVSPEFVGEPKPTTVLIRRVKVTKGLNTTKTGGKAIPKPKSEKVGPATVQKSSETKMSKKTTDEKPKNEARAVDPIRLEFGHSSGGSLMRDTGRTLPEENTQSPDPLPKDDHQESPSMVGQLEFLEQSDEANQEIYPDQDSQSLNEPIPRLFSNPRIDKVLTDNPKSRIDPESAQQKSRSSHGVPDHESQSQNIETEALGQPECPENVISPEDQNPDSQEDQSETIPEADASEKSQSSKGGSIP
jgi:hypothetical protein